MTILYYLKLSYSTMSGDSMEAIKNPWNTLSTVNSFDRGSTTPTTVRVDNNNDIRTSNGQLVERTVPCTSLLIESLVQQLCIMFEGDTVRRNKLYYTICDRLHELNLIDGSYNMNEFELLRGQYQRALYHLVTIARAATGSESPLNVPSCLMSEWSRYRREFQEISFIAAGGFGNVFKALHRLDGTEYAIKKIVVRSGRVKTIMKHVEEVKTLAKLNHPNIVPYKAAWIEPTFPTTLLPCLPSSERSQNGSRNQMKRTKSRYSRLKTTEKEECVSDQVETSPNRISHVTDSSYSTSMYIKTESLSHQSATNGSAGGYIVSHDIINERFRELKSTTNIVGPRIVETHSTDDLHESNSDVVSFRNDSNCRISYTEDTDYHGNWTDDSESNEDTEDKQEICPYNSQTNQRYATLYIQMALCDRTLQQWLEERNGVTSTHIITTILEQIVCGVDYIHNQGIVHHDIKPSNLFISTSGPLQIQLGDFGLACPLQRESHHSVLGTHMYAAPEQLQGKCNKQSDVYSIGIVLLELLVPTRTQMERISIINGVKRGQIPTDLTVNHPNWIRMVSQLVQKDPRKRPSTTVLLEDLREDKDALIAQLRQDITKKDSTIQELQAKISLLEAQCVKHNIPLNPSQV